MKRHYFVLLAIAFQVISVASIALSKEWILMNGNEMIFQTAPIDPRDIFRGDYVRLDYPFSHIDTDQLSADILTTGLRKGQKVYLSLELNKQGIAQGKQLSTTPPSQPPYLAGQVKNHWPYRDYIKHRSRSKPSPISSGNPVQIKYGLEQYYVEQGAGLEMEKIRGRRNSFQVPMLIHAAVSEQGEALIRSFEWANIAMKTEIIKSPERNAPDNLASATVRFTLLNLGTKTISLPWKENGCSFSLIPTTKRDGDLPFQRTECLNLPTTTRKLEANEQAFVDFDLNHTQWWVEYKGEKTPMGKLPWNYRFRITHNRAEIAAINARIISRAFHGRGQVD
jgi:uncharacterized membrane-anchored protein